MKAGAGKSRIFIPQEVFPLEGCTREETPIHARALVLDYEEKTVIVSLELPSVRNPGDMAALKATAARETGVPVGSVWMCTTHNLSAIHIPPEEEMPQKHGLVLAAVDEAVKSACRAAVRRLRSSKIGIGTGTCDINTSRDIYTNQGWWNGINGVSREDKLLTVFKFESMDGEPLALLYHYPVKCCTAQGAVYPDGTRVCSSELSGVSSTRIEASINAPAIFFMGAAADMVPKLYASYSKADEDGNLVSMDFGLKKGLAVKDELGRILAEAVLEIFERISCRENVPLRQTQVCYEYPGQKFYYEGKPYHPTPDYVYLPGEPQTLEATLLALDNTVLIGIMPETTAITGIQLREKADGFVPLLVSLVNGGKDYMADELSYDRCTFSGTHSVFARGSAERFVADILQRIEEWLRKGNEQDE